MRRLLLVLPLAVCLVATMAGAARPQASEPEYLGQPAWSPDGKHIAWVAGPPNGYGTVWVADASGQNARPLHQFGQSLGGDDYVAQIEWLTPSSLLVGAALTDVLGLYRLNLSGDITRVWPVTDLPVSIDRARHLVATDNLGRCGFTSCPAEIHVLHLASGKVTRAGSKGELDGSPALSPNGRRVAYERATCNSSRCGKWDGIWLASVSGTGKPRKISDLPAGDYPTWSPDGRSIVYMLGSRGEDLAIVRPGSKPRILPRSGGDADFSPDSRLLAYEGVANKGSSNPTIGHLVVLNLHTHRAVLVSPRWLGDILGHSWSPDGKTLIFAARPNEACSSLYTVTLRAPHWKLFRSC